MTVDNYTTDPYYPRIMQAVAAALHSHHFVSPLQVFLALGVLERQAVEEWRKGHIPYLERVLKCNLAKASRILRILRLHAHDLNLKPSMTVHRRKLHGRTLPLQFSKSGDHHLEEAYARHFVPSGQGNAHTALTTEPSAAAQPRPVRDGRRPPQTV
jgi:hypothetical protein